MSFGYPGWAGFLYLAVVLDALKGLTEDLEAGGAHT
jgi:hypothetical protein